MTSPTIRVFIGYDSREAAAFSVLAHSIHARASQPVSVTPLKLEELREVFRRERNPLQSTDFSFSRFLTPYLCGYEGWAVFMDCDMLALDDIARLWDLRDDSYAVMCVKHDHVPTDWKHDGVRVIPGNQLDPNVPSTAGMDRKAAINFARVGAQKLWAGTVTIHAAAMLKTWWRRTSRRGSIESTVAIAIRFFSPTLR